VSDYAAYREDRMRVGEEYQDFVVDLMFKKLGWPIMQHVSAKRQLRVGESASRVEIKFQERYRETGNLWIETAEKARPRPGEYAPSGITERTHDNAIFLVTGDYTTVFLFAKSHLNKLAESKQYTVLENRTKTSMGFLLPDRHAWFLADFVWSDKRADSASQSTDRPRSNDPSSPFGRVTEEQLQEIGRVCFGIQYPEKEEIAPKAERI